MPEYMTGTGDRQGIAILRDVLLWLYGLLAQRAPTLLLYGSAFLQGHRERGALPSMSSQVNREHSRLNAALQRPQITQPRARDKFDLRSPSRCLLLFVAFPRQPCAIPSNHCISDAHMQDYGSEGQMRCERRSRSLICSTKIIEKFNSVPTLGAVGRVLPRTV